MGRSYTNIKVDRTKLIEKLETRLSEINSEKDRRFKEELNKQIASAKTSFKNAEETIKKLEKIKTIEDANGEYWATRLDRSEDLERQINLLKMSDQEQLLISPSSNLYNYL